MRTRAFGKMSLLRPRPAREFASELFALHYEQKDTNSIKSKGGLSAYKACIDEKNKE